MAEHACINNMNCIRYNHVIKVSCQYSHAGWLEPLLHRIKENYTNVLVPVIDVIDDNTFNYNGLSGGGIRSVFVGGFDWGLLFNWHPIPDSELKRIHHKNHLPVR